jgi:drug/metabolite transporter (DMT)-like permease
MGALLGLLSALSIGFADLFARRVLREASPFVTSFLVSAFAALTSVVAVIAFGSSLKPADFGIGLMSGIGMGVGIAAYYGAIHRSSATLVSPIIGVLSAVLPYSYATLRGAPLSVRALLGAVIALCGVTIVSMRSFDAGGTTRSGLIWALVSGVAYGIGLAVVLDASKGAGALPAVGQRVGASVLLAAVLSVHRSRPTVSKPGVASGVFAGLFAGLTTILYLAGARFDATATIVTSSMFPAASVAVGYLFFAESVSRKQIVGLLIALAGIIAVVTG